MKDLNEQQLQKISGGESLWGAIVNWFTGGDNSIQTTGKNPFDDSSGGTTPVIRYTVYND